VFYQQNIGDDVSYKFVRRSEGWHGAEQAVHEEGGDADEKELRPRL
jgi:hypothetical protein